MKIDVSKLISSIKRRSLEASEQSAHSTYNHDKVHHHESLISHETPEGPGKEQLREVLAKLLPLDPLVGPWIAGGAARRILQGRSLEDGDIDLFFHSFKSWSDFEKDLINKGYEKTYRSTNATTFDVDGRKVQIIRRRYYESLRDVLRDFDVTASQVAVHGDRVIALKTAGDDIKANVLRYAEEGRVVKASAVPRGLKYINYGFVPEPGYFRRMIKEGLSCSSTYTIFEGEEAFTSSFYDTDEIESLDKMAEKEHLENAYKAKIMEILNRISKKHD